MDICKVIKLANASKCDGYYTVANAAFAAIVSAAFDDKGKGLSAHLEVEGFTDSHLGVADDSEQIFYELTAIREKGSNGEWLSIPLPMISGMTAVALARATKTESGKGASTKRSRPREKPVTDWWDELFELVPREDVLEALWVLQPERAPAHIGWEDTEHQVPHHLTQIERELDLRPESGTTERV